MKKPGFLKWLPILISLIAVSISCLSWWESHRGRIIQEGINRPQFRVEEAELTRSYGVLRFNLRNVGRTPATITKISFTQHLPKFLRKLCALSRSSDAGKPFSFNVSKFTDVLPGDYQYVGESFDLSECEYGDTIGGDLVIEYRNTVTGEQYSQSTGLDAKVN